MTPSLAAVHEQLVAAAAAPEFAHHVSEIRARFVERVGPFSPTDPWFEERSAALWDRVLCDRRVLSVLRERAPEHSEVVDNLWRAQRGLFEVRPAARTVDVVCVVSGAAFRLSSADDAARAMSHAHGGEGGWIDGHVVASSEGVALLPGFLVHSAEATEPMRALVHTAMEFDALLDALLAMRHQLAARSRMKAKQVYRAEALPRTNVRAD